MPLADPQVADLPVKPHATALAEPWSSTHSADTARWRGRTRAGFPARAFSSQQNAMTRPHDSFFVSLARAEAEEPFEERAELGQHALLLLTVPTRAAKREAGGSTLVIAVPVVLISPSRKAASMNALVSSGLRFSSSIIALSSSV